MTAQQLGLLLLQHGDREVVIKNGDKHEYIKDINPSPFTDRLYIDTTDQIEDSMKISASISIQTKK